MNFLLGPLTWAFAIIVGGMLITPDGVIPIVFERIAGGVAIVLGAVGLLVGSRRSQ